MAKSPNGATKAKSATVNASATESMVGDTFHASTAPPQSAGTPQTMFSVGAPPKFRKYSITMQILANPEARNTFQQPYSGQRRNWQS